MSRYTREEILHLRESPIIVFHTPPLPEWISAAAIATAAQNKQHRNERQNPDRSQRTNDAGNEETVVSTPAKLSKNERQDLSSSRSGRTPAERTERLDEKPEPSLKRSERGRNDRNDPSAKNSREPKKPDDALENFGSRRLRNADGSVTSRNLRAKEQEQEFTFRASIKSRSSQPEWAAHETEPVEEIDDAAGKTVDDFERWKRSMKKNDGSGDTGLPPLNNDSSISDSHQALRETEEPIKDVKPPPGFAGIMPKPPTELSFDTPDAKEFMGDASTDDSIRAPSNATLPPGFGTSISTPSTSNVQSTVKPTGTSKFSKFFSQTSQAQVQPLPQPQSQNLPEYKNPETTSQSKKGASDLFASMMGPKSSGNKDDAEGFERILAMLSSQTAPSRQQTSAIGDSRHKQALSGSYQEQSHQGIPTNTQQQSASQSQYGRPYYESNQAQSASRFDDMATNTSGFSYPPQAPGGRIPAAAQHERSHDNVRYDIDRAAMPSMRDSSGGPSSILNHHTQNQDFFSSLLSSQPQQQSYGGGRERTLEHLNAAPALKDSHNSHNVEQFARQRPTFDPRIPQLSHNVYGNEEQHMHRQRQQQAQTQAPQPPRAHGELDFLNQLMAEQRINSNQYQKGPYSSHAQNPHQQLSQLNHGQQPPQGFVTGIGSRPGPGWNGQFEVDPRIPSSSQFRP